MKKKKLKTGKHAPKLKRGKPVRVQRVVRCGRALSDQPQDLGEHDWYYEERKHLTLVHEVLDLKTGEYIRTDQIKIPWAKMFRSIHRAYLTTGSATRTIGVWIETETQCRKGIKKAK